jgi:hypothetical protein
VSESLTITLHNRQQAWADIKGLAYPFLAKVLQSGARWVLTLKLETRSQAQNRLMWPLLTVFSQQLQWPVDGRMVTMDADDWKDVLSAAFKGESVRLAMGLNGGVVLLGQRTSKFTKPQFAEWIEFLYATAADRGVKLPVWVGQE